MFREETIELRSSAPYRSERPPDEEVEFKTGYVPRAILREKTAEEEIREKEHETAVKLKEENASIRSSRLRKSKSQASESERLQATSQLHEQAPEPLKKSKSQASESERLQASSQVHKA